MRKLLLLSLLLAGVALTALYLANQNSGPATAPGASDDVTEGVPASLARELGSAPKATERTRVDAGFPLLLANHEPGLPLNAQAFDHEGARVPTTVSTGEPTTVHVASGSRVLLAVIATGRLPWIGAVSDGTPGRLELEPLHSLEVSMRTTGGSPVQGIAMTWSPDTQDDSIALPDLGSLLASNATGQSDRLKLRSGRRERMGTSDLCAPNRSSLTDATAAPVGE